MKTLRTAVLIALPVSFGGIDNLKAQTNANQQTPLSARQQHIVVIPALTARGNLQPLQPALAGGLDAGLTINEIKEVLVHLYTYSGFPRSIRGLNTFIAVLDERKKKGITNAMGKEASPITSPGAGQRHFCRHEQTHSKITRRFNPYQVNLYRFVFT